MGGEGTIQATFTQDVTEGSYYETAHVKSEQVRQPSLLVGGELKAYQLSGLQWLVRWEERRGVEERKRDKEESERERGRRGHDSIMQQFSILNYVDDDDGSSYKKRINVIDYYFNG